MLSKNYFYLYAILGLLFLSLTLSNTQYIYILIIYMLFIPLLDGNWHINLNIFDFNESSFYLWSGCILSIILVAGLNKQLWVFSVFTLLFAALPEEFFFRGYLQIRLGNSVSAIFFCSLIFSVTHMLTISIYTGILVFFPSLLYGYLFRKTGDLLFVILLHTLSNTIYIAYLTDFFEYHILSNSF